MWTRSRVFQATGLLETMREKRFIILGAIGIVIVGVGSWLGAPGTRTQPGNKPGVSSTVVRPVPTAMVRPFPDTCVRTFPGKVRATRRVELAFSVPGLLETLNVREGDSVAEGCVLGELDKRDYRNSLDVAKAKYLDSKLAFDRAQSLRDSKVICQAELDKAEAAYKVALAELRISEKAMEDTRLTAPFEGSGYQAVRGKS